MKRDNALSNGEVDPGAAEMEMRRFGLADGVVLLVVLLLAVGSRAWYLHELADSGTTAEPTRVQDDRSQELIELVKNLRKGKGFRSHAPLSRGEEATAHTSPAYPWLLAAVADRVDDWQTLVRWLQGGLGTVTAGLYFLFARRAFRSLLVAALAGVLCALHPFWVIATAELNDGVLAAFLLGACLFFGARASQESGPTASLLYGLGLAGLALVRAALLPFAVIAMLWFLARSRTLRRGWLCALLAFLGFINGLVPWTLRNMREFGEILPIVDSAYYHLWVGNYPGSTGGAQKLNSRSAVPAELADLENVKNQPDRYDQLASKVLYNVTTDPAGALQHRLQAGLAFMFGADWYTHECRMWRGDDQYEGILYGSLLAMLLLAFLGWRWSFDWRHLSMPMSLAVIWVPLPYLLSHAEALSGPRLPLDGVLLCYAAFALACFVPIAYPGAGRFLREGPEPVPSKEV
jgi:hypothetical protein